TCTSHRPEIYQHVSGGAGGPDDFYEALTRGKADAVLAAGVFHFGQIRIPELKCFLKGKGIVVR
ncbi:MAG: hypothetical protein IJO84_00600, partial [Butyricimonas sp.]|nr:hypothetical protein [Butyricimonas sp.]